MLAEVVANVLPQRSPHSATCRPISKFLVEGDGRLVELPNIQLALVYLLVQCPPMSPLNKRSTNSEAAEDLPYYKIVDHGVPPWHHDRDIGCLSNKYANQADDLAVTFGNEQSRVLICDNVGDKLLRAGGSVRFSKEMR